MTAPAIDDRRSATLRRRVRLIVGFTITYNVIEAVVAIMAGIAASSAALIGFGLDSTVEVFSAAVIAWQFSTHDHVVRERTAMRLVAVAFFALAAYVTFDAVTSLAGAGEAQPSTVGIVLAALSLAVMPTVSWLERRAGRELGSSSVVADSKQTLLCAWLSGVLLVGLVANAAWGINWLDPVAALVIAGVAVREGREAWRGDVCCSPASALRLDDDADDACACDTDCSS